MELITYGRSSGFCIDPVEKKPLNHFLPGSSVLSFGTAGCNMGCNFCQNWDISKAKQDDRLQSRASPEAIAQAALDSKCASVAYTYNDPVIFLEYASDVAQACKEVGVKSVAVTAGYIEGAAREDFFSHMDAANVDLKGFTEKFYRENCKAHLQPVLDTLEYLAKETPVWVEVTTLLIPGLNDSNEELEKQCQWMAEKLGSHVPLHFSAFHPDYKMRHIPHTPKDTLTRARNIALRNGLKYVFTGNVHDTVGASTYCPSCNALLVERDWFQLREYNLQGNTCKHCGETVHGVFPDQPPKVSRDPFSNQRPVLQRVRLEQHAKELERRYQESRKDLMLP
jgi:pyruvate formate lyase activating enzyme